VNRLADGRVILRAGSDSGQSGAVIWLRPFSFVEIHDTIMPASKKATCEDE
jgi:hypothetical protein